MAYSVRTASRRVERELASLPPRAYPRVRDAIRRLADNPRPRGSVKLQGDIHRIRVGRYRVIYLVDDMAQEVVITKVTLRTEHTYD